MSGAVKQAARSLGNNVKEFRLHLCQTSSSSAGVRNFIEQHYVPLKVANPHMPIMVRECSGVVPRVYARYNLGVERSVELTDMNSNQVLSSIQNLAKKI
ncbi:uncharacterized protein LOC142334551 [Convolutriloba macropyga]|uniref:uncharacterized protein LOC142334551 n=1 Tax=Convolutriloba macropyga TaxID=536237 RepID=UPI003F51CEAA